METYRIKQVTEIFNINSDTVHSYIRKALPEDMKPKKTMQEGLGRETYEFTEKNIKNLKKAIKLKSIGLTYKRVKEELVLDNISVPVHPDQIVEVVENTNESEEVMNELTLKGLAEVDGMKFNHIEGGFGENKKAMLVKDIAEIHDREQYKVNELINNNKKRFKYGVDIIDLKQNEFAILLKDNGIYSQNSINASKNIYLLSERGYSKLLKILEDDFAWEQYEKLVDGYFSMRETIQAPLEGLSPQLQLLISMEMKQSQLEVAVTETKREVENTKQQIQEMKDIIIINPRTEWRQSTNKILLAVGKKMNDYAEPKRIAYEALQERARCRPNVLVNNLRNRALGNGMAPSKANKLNLLDVLENDPRLKEIYIEIVKAMANKYL